MAHAHKLQALIQTARERKWNTTMLSELHFCEEDWRDTDNFRPQVVFIEEFALIQWYKVGFLLDCPTRMNWETLGRKFVTCGPRILSLITNHQDMEYHWISVYASIQSEQTERREFFGKLTGLINTLPHERLCIGGDWNSHMGSDTVQRGSLVKTTIGGLEIQQFWHNTNFLQVVDHKHPIQNRGTWRHSVKKAWYELDYMIATRDMTRRLQNARVQPYPYSDHMAKILCFLLCQASQHNWKGQRSHEAQRPTIP